MPSIKINAATLTTNAVSSSSFEALSFAGGADDAPMFGRGVDGALTLAAAYDPTDSRRAGAATSIATANAEKFTATPLSGSTLTAMTFAGSAPVGYVTGIGIAPGSTFTGVFPGFTFFGGFGTNGSNTISGLSMDTTPGSSSGVCPGMQVSSAGVPANTYITGINTVSGIVTLSANLTADISMGTIVFAKSGVLSSPLLATSTTAGAYTSSTAAPARSADAPTVVVTGIATGNAVLTVAPSTTGRCWAADFWPDDICLVINVQGSNGTSANVGNCEFVRVASIDTVAQTVTLRAPLAKVYGNSSNSAISDQRILLVRVPEYTALTLNTGGYLNVAPWNGSAGGVLPVMAQNIVGTSGQTSVDVSLCGFRSRTVGGLGGEGDQGLGPTSATALGTAGGGGVTGNAGTAGVAGANMATAGSNAGAGGGGGGGGGGGHGGGGSCGGVGGDGSATAGGGAGGAGGGNAASGGIANSISVGGGASAGHASDGTHAASGASGSGGNGGGRGLGSTTVRGSALINQLYFGGSGGNAGAGGSGGIGGTGGNATGGGGSRSGGGGGGGGTGGGFSKAATVTAGANGTNGSGSIAATGGGSAAAAGTGGAGGAGGGIALVLGRTISAVTIKANGQDGTIGVAGYAGLAGGISGTDETTRGGAGGGGGVGGAGGGGAGGSIVVYGHAASSLTLSATGGVGKTYSAASGGTVSSSASGITGSSGAGSDGRIKVSTYSLDSTQSAAQSEGAGLGPGTPASYRGVL